MPIICKCSRGCSQARRTYVDETPTSQIKSEFVFHHLIHKILVQLPSCCTKTCSTTKPCVSLLILELEYDQHLLCNYSYMAVLLLYREENVYICCRISLMNHDGILFRFSLSLSLSLSRVSDISRGTFTNISLAPGCCTRCRAYEYS
jgi:hypothetical protein